MTQHKLAGLKVAVAGLGRRMGTVLANLHRAAGPLVIAGHCDPAPVGLDVLAPHGVEPGPAFGSVDAMMDAVKPDVLFVGSPNHLHFEHIRAGLEAGALVFTEKPVVRTRAETFALADLLRVHGNERVLVGLVLRSAPLVRATAAAIRGGKLGRLVSMEANEHLHPEHGGFLARDWRRRSDWGGSYLLDKCCHDFDLYRHFVGALPARVACFGGRSLFGPGAEAMRGRRYESGDEAYRLWPAGWGATNDPFTEDMDATDHETALVEYENGVRLSFHSNTHSAILQRRWMICGTHGTLEADLVTNEMKLAEGLGERAPDVTTYPGKVQGHYGADRQMAHDLVATLLEGAPFPARVEDAMIAGLTVMALDEARETGRVVDCAGTWRELEARLGRDTLSP